MFVFVITDKLKWIFTNPILTPLISDFVFYYDSDYDIDYSDYLPGKELIVISILMGLCLYVLYIYLQKPEEMSQKEKEDLTRRAVEEQAKILEEIAKK